VSVRGWQTAAQDHEDVSSPWACAAFSHRICTGIPGRRLGELIGELAGPWMAQQESRLRERRGGGRRRAAGAGPGHDLVFTDRVITTLVILRFQLPHAALALFYGWTVPRSPGPSMRSGRCSRPAASPSPATADCGCARSGHVGDLAHVLGVVA
jgi:hypothetical protein